MTATSHINPELICGICHDLLNEPTELPCGHTFCRRPCLLGNDAVASFAACPHCYIEVNETQLVSNNDLAKRVQEHRTKDEMCSSCRRPSNRRTLCTHCKMAMCDFCYETHIIKLRTDVSKKLVDTKKLKMMLQNYLCEEPSNNAERNAIETSIDDVNARLHSVGLISLRKAEQFIENTSHVEEEKLRQMLTVHSELSQRFSTISTNEVPYDNEISSLINFIDSAESLLKDIRWEKNSISRCYKRSLNHWGISDMYTSIGVLLEKFGLISINDFTSSSINREPIGEDSSDIRLHPSNFGTEKSECVTFDDFSTVESRRCTPSKPIMPSCICIYDLPSELNGNDLNAYFQRFGIVHRALVKLNSDNGVNHRCGFVYYGEYSAVKKVLSSSPHIINGLLLNVNEHLEESAQSGSNRHHQYDFVDDDSKSESSVDFSTAESQRCRSIKPIKTSCICIDDLQPQIYGSDLNAYFKRFGIVHHAFVKINSNHGVNHRRGFVYYGEFSAVKKALSSSPHRIKGCLINLHEHLEDSAVLGSIRQHSSEFGTANSECESFDDFSTVESKRCTPRKSLMTSCVCIDYLPSQINGCDLNTYFKRFGLVNRALVKINSNNGVNYRCGLVYYGEYSAVRKALSSSPHRIKGLQLNVHEHMEDSAQSGSNGQESCTDSKSNIEEFSRLKKGDFSLNPNNTKNCICIDDLQLRLNASELKSYFRPYGALERAVVVKNLNNGIHRRFGFVYFSDYSIVSRVLSARPHRFQGILLKVREYNDKSTDVDLDRELNEKNHSDQTDLDSKNSDMNTIRLRCPQWPTCQMRPPNCMYVHPRVRCRTKKQHASDTCCFLHPEDMKYVQVCQRGEERIGHSKTEEALAREQPVAVGMNENEENKNRLRCPNWPICQRKPPQCMYMHPYIECRNEKPHERNSCCFLHPEDLQLTKALEAFRQSEGNITDQTYQNSARIPIDNSDCESLNPAANSVDKIYPKIWKRCPRWPGCPKPNDCPFAHPYRECLIKKLHSRESCCFLHPEDKKNWNNYRRNRKKL